MAGPRALIELIVDGADESRRRIETVRDAMRGMDSESLERISGQMGGLTDRFEVLQSTVGKVAGFAVAGLSLATLGSKVVDAMNSMAELDDLSQKVGTSVERLSQIQKAAKAFGVDFAGAVDPAIVKLSIGLSTVDEKSSQARKALAAIGMTARDSAGKIRDPGDAMVEVAKRLQDYEDGAGKAAVVNALFGESGVKLMPFLNDLADSVDGFSVVTKEAVAQATGLQDKFTALGQRTDEVFQKVTIAALPAMSGLAQGFADVLKAQDGIVDSGELGDWSKSVAMGIARVADVAVLGARTVSALSSSVKVMVADLELLWTVSPANMAINLAQGKSPLDEVRKVSAERDKILEGANKKWKDFYNASGNDFEQAVLKQFTNRVVDTAPNPGKGDKKKGQVDFGNGGAAADAQADAYRKLTAAIQAKIVQSNLELQNAAPLSASQQEQLRLTEQYAAVKSKLSPIQRANVEALIQEAVTTLEVIESNKRAAEGLESYNKQRAQYEASAAKAIADAQAEAATNEQLALTFGKTKGEIEALELARLEEQLAQRSSKILTLDEIANLEQLIAAKKRNAAALGKIDTMEAGRKAAESLDAFLDPARAQSFGEALREAFGGAGTAISELTSSLDGFSKRQADFDKQRANAKLARDAGAKTEMQYIQDMSRLSEMETKNRLSGYGDMAGAAAGFFGEQSRGYQVMMTVSKAFHAAELAMTMAELVPKGISAVLSQGSGDPYTAFGRMAAMAAIVAGLGVAIGGIGGSGKDTTAKDRQAAFGTGSVFGDADAKSDSIARAMSILEENSGIQLSYTSDMVSSLRSIENSLGGLGNLLVRTAGLTGQMAPNKNGGAYDFGASTTGLMATGGPLAVVLDKLTGGLVGKLTGKIFNGLFGGKVTTLDTGVTFGAKSLADVFQTGVVANQYTDTKKDGGLFGSDKYRTQLAGLGGEADAQFSLIIRNLASTIGEAGDLLGLQGDAFNTRLNSFVVDMGKISLKDMKAEDIQKALEAGFSKLGDDMAKWGVAGLEQFQQVGEGYFETLARVSSNYANLDSIMMSIGTTFGAVGIESLTARERLIAMGGGISSLAGQADSFAQNFLTEAQRLAPVQKYVTEQLAAMGLSSVNTRDKFRDVALGMDKTTEAGAKQFTALMNLADVFAQVYPAVEDFSKSMQEIADERKSLQDRLDELTMTREQLLAKERDALDESNRPLWDRIQALEAESLAIQSVKDVAAGLLGGVDGAFGVLQRVVDREQALLQTQVKAHTDAANKLRAVTSSLRSTIDGMRGPGQEVADRARAQGDLSMFISLARAGGVFPDSDKLQSTLNILSQDASAQFETFADYQRDFFSTRNSMADLAALSDAALTTEERTLKTLEEQLNSFDEMLKREQEQIDVLKGQSITGLSILDALRALQGTMLAAQQNPFVASSAAINSAYQTHLGRAPDAAGFDWWKNAAASGTPIGQIVDGIANSTEGKLNKLYESVLGRAPDAEGLAFWMKAYGSTMDAGEIADFTKVAQGTDEWKKLNKVPGFATGGDHAGGWRIVGENGPELEATGSSRIFNASQTSNIMNRLMQPSSGSDALVAEVRALRAEVAMLREANSAENRAIAGGAQATAEHLDAAINGDKPFATKAVPA